MRTLPALVAFLALVIASQALAGPIADAPCPRGDALLNHLPVNLADVSGIVPLGNLNPGGGHTIPTRHIYVYPRMTTPGDPSSAIDVRVLAPGKTEIVAVEYRPSAPDWSVHLKPCRDVSLYYFHVDKLAADIAAAVGDVTVGGVAFPDFTAKAVAIPLAPGQMVGVAQTFDIGLHDYRKPPQPFVNQLRYKVDLPVLAASVGIPLTPEALDVARRIVPQALYNRCPIDYFTPLPRAQMTARLSDYDGAPLASGTPRCHSHMQDVAQTAQGNWWNDLDPVHDALMDEQHAIALVNWNVTPTVQLFSLNETVPGFSSSLLEGAPPASYANNRFEFPVREGPQRTNRRFAEITDNALYCYDLVRIHRGGPRLNAVILIQVDHGPGGARRQLKIEFVRTSRCPALPRPWRFSGREATYHR